MKRVEVEWIDSMMLNYGEWADREDHETALNLQEITQHSCGYLFSDSDDAIILAGTVYGQGDPSLPDRAAGAMLIPRCAIRSIKELRTDER